MAAKVGRKTWPWGALGAGRSARPISNPAIPRAGIPECQYQKAGGWPGRTKALAMPPRSTNPATMQRDEHAPVSRRQVPRPRRRRTRHSNGHRRAHHVNGIEAVEVSAPHRVRFRIGCRVIGEHQGRQSSGPMGQAEACWRACSINAPARRKDVAEKGDHGWRGWQE